MELFRIVVTYLLLLMAALATPVAIALGLYDWVISDMEFKYALWKGFKSWLIMIGLGLGVGLPLHFYNMTKQ